MFGGERGGLAVSLDRLTNALVLVGQHAVYCPSQRNPGVPAMDIRMVTQELTHAKELVQSVMEELRKAKEEARQERKFSERLPLTELFFHKEAIRLALLADVGAGPRPGKCGRSM